MYLLDTNVVSELRKTASNKADENVVIWAQSVAAKHLYLSAVSVMELEMGVLLVERRDVAQGKLLRNWLTRNVLSAFDGRILPVDTAVALKCAQLHVPDPKSERDALIAATALVSNMTVVTRNSPDFKYTGVQLINPWLSIGS